VENERSASNLADQRIYPKGSLPCQKKYIFQKSLYCTTNKQNLEVFEEHLHGVYNAKRERFADAAKFIKQREEFTALGDQITMKEFVRAIKKLKNGKAQGVTGVAPDAFKCLEGVNQKQIYWYIVDFWEGTADYWEWHVGLGVLVPKKGDLSDPKNVAASTSWMSAPKSSAAF